MDRATSRTHPAAKLHHLYGRDPFRGLAWDLAPILVERLDAAGIPAQRHVTNIIAEIDGNEARVESYFLSFNPDQPPDGNDMVVTLTAGRYLDRFEKRDGNWRIAGRKVIIDWSEQGEASHRRWWRAGEFPSGNRREKDPSHALFATGFRTEAASASIAGLGRIAQLAFVPPDMDQALRFWTEVIGVGPFFRNREVRLPGVRFEGADVDITLDVALAYWNDIQIELLCQVEGPPTIYHPSDGLHHVLILVDDLEDARERCLSAGLSLALQGVAEGMVHFVYLGQGRQRPMIELAQRCDDLDTYFAKVRTAARNWDGTAKIRETVLFNA